MSQVEVVDRDYSNVEAAENDKRKKASSKVKLTEISKKAIDAVYAVTRKKEKKLEKVQNQIEEQEKEQMEEISYVKYFFNEIKLKGLKMKKAKLEKKVQKEKLRALRITESMKKGMLFKYASRFDSEKEIDVEEINRSDIAEEIKKQFEQMQNNIKNNEEKVSNNNENVNSFASDLKEKATSEKEFSEQKADTEEVQMNKPRSRFTYETNDEYENYLSDFYSGTYSMGKNDIVQDEIVMSKENEPGLDAFFASLRNVTPEASENLVSSEEEKEQVSVVEEPGFSEKTEEPTPIVETSEDIVSKVNDSLNNQNITSMDLLKLREELETERNRKSQLTEELQEKMKQAAVAEKEAAAALQEQQEKMKLVQDELAAYKEENKRLVDQTQKVEETTQRQISMRQQSLDYINSLNEMMGPRAVNVIVNENTRGGK